MEYNESLGSQDMTKKKFMKSQHQQFVAMEPQMDEVPLH